MDFSGIIKITDLNDFLKPAENCSVHNNMIKTSVDKTAKVSLSDCLACSGCITSAETVLLEQHSVSTLMEKIGQEHITVSLSQQSCLAIASELNLPLPVVISKLSMFLKGLGVNEVYSMCYARDYVLESSYLEFRERLAEGKAPLLCSECPGWVCYALKKGDAGLVPLMSKVKTPMLVQRQLHQIIGYHVAVMPCFDKKLEGVMEEGVDLVLTTNEILSIVGDLSGPLDTQASEFHSSTIFKSSSLGYAEYIFKKSVKEIYGLDIPIELKTTRRRDVLEMEYQELKFCIASGFQNIQNLIREIKMKKCKYSYIEIMACPIGCLNGGGQPKMTREIINSIEGSTAEYFREKETIVKDDIKRELKLLETHSLRW